MINKFIQCIFLCVLSGLTGCSNLLPNTKEIVHTPWHSYNQAEAMFEKVIPGQTTRSELSALGVDPTQTSNVSILAHTDLLHRLIVSPNMNVQFIDPRLKECMDAYQMCYGYEIDQTYLEHQRTGNFWADFLNFNRVTNISGWQFDAIFVIKNDLVIYKLWSGKPRIERSEKQRSPLGPLQGLGSSFRR